MTSLTGPNFEVEDGATHEWVLTPDAPSDLDGTAVLRLARRVLSPLPANFRGDNTPSGPAWAYETVYQDDTLEVDTSTVTVVLSTSGLPGIEYLWQVDLITAEGTLQQRWRGLAVVTSALPPL